MKTRLLIILGIIAIIGISAFLIAYVNHEQYANKNTASNFNYKDIKSITQDTYLNKTIFEWQNESMDSLMSYHEKFGDGFFSELGAFVLKNDFKNELKKQNIEVNYDFKLHPTETLLSLPPHVGFESYVNSTDGNTYRLMGMTYQSKVESTSITKMQFFDTSVKLPLESILSQNNTIQVLGSNGQYSDAKPYSLVIQGNKDIEVQFQNTLKVPIRIQGDGDWQNPNWYGPIIMPLSIETMKFGNPGYYSWNARTYPESESMGSGMINIIPDDFNKLTKEEKAVIGTGIIHNSEIPWLGLSDNHVGFGGDYIGIYVGFSDAIKDVLPNSTQYYTARIKQLVPFDLPIMIEDGK
jgi:hypothetical protein